MKLKYDITLNVMNVKILSRRFKFFFRYFIRKLVL